MTQAEAERFNVALYRVIERDFWGGAKARTPAVRRAAATSPRF